MKRAATASAAMLQQLIQAQRRDDVWLRRPIRLGGELARWAKTEAARSVEVLGDISIATRPAAIEVDQWQTLLAAAGFSEQERRYVTLRWIEAMAPRALREQTGWTRAEVEKLRAAVHGRMVGMRTRKPTITDRWEALTSAYGHVYIEVLPSGKLLYSMRMPEPFPLLSGSKQMYLKDPVFSGVKYVRPPLTTKEGIKLMLETRLQEAKLLYGRIWTQRRDAEVATDQAEIGVDAAKKSLGTEEEAAVIEERRVSPAAVKRVTDAEAALQAATRHFEATARAYDKQGSLIEAILGEIESRRLETTLAKLASPRKRLVAAIHELQAASVDVANILSQSGMAYFDLFPSADPAEPLMRFTGRAMAVQAYRVGLGIAREEAQFGGRKALA